MENVGPVKIEIEYDPLMFNGTIRVNIESLNFVDNMLVITMALRKDDRLRMLVKQSIDFLER